MLDVLSVKSNEESRNLSRYFFFFNGGNLIKVYMLWKNREVKRDYEAFQMLAIAKAASNPGLQEQE